MQIKKSKIGKWKTNIGYWKAETNNNFNLDLDDEILFKYMDYQEMLERKFRYIKPEKEIEDYKNKEISNFIDDSKSSDIPDTWYVDMIIGDESKNNIENATNFLTLFSDVVKKAIKESDNLYVFFNRI